MISGKHVRSFGLGKVGDGLVPFPHADGPPGLSLEMETQSKFVGSSYLSGNTEANIVSLHHDVVSSSVICYSLQSTLISAVHAAANTPTGVEILRSC
jgi:hypothetical protein